MELTSFMISIDINVPDHPTGSTSWAESVDKEEKSNLPPTSFQHVTSVATTSKSAPMQTPTKATPREGHPQSTSTTKNDPPKSVPATAKTTPPHKLGTRLPNRLVWNQFHMSNYQERDLPAPQTTTFGLNHLRCTVSKINLQRSHGH